MEKTTKEQVVKIAAKYAKEKGIKDKYLSIRLGLTPSGLSNAKSRGMNDEMFEKYIEALGGSVEKIVAINNKIYNL